MHWAIRNHKPGFDFHGTDICVPISKLPDAIEYCQNLFQILGTEGIIFFCRLQVHQDLATAGQRTVRPPAVARQFCANVICSKFGMKSKCSEILSTKYLRISFIHIYNFTCQ